MDGIQQLLLFGVVSIKAPFLHDLESEVVELTIQFIQKADMKRLIVL